MPHTIYGLTDPVTECLRYVGSTSQKLGDRLAQHMCHSVRVKRLGAWVHDLKSRGLRPGIFEIESVSPNEWEGAEQFWISYFKSIGADLANASIGGNVGGKGAPRTAEENWRRGSGRRGRPHTAETRAKMAATHAGKKCPWNAVTGQRYRKLTDAQVSEIKTSEKAGKDLAAEYGVSETTISNIKRGVKLKYATR